MKEDAMQKETSLYRKYRPQAFADVRGQDHVTSVLQAAAHKGKIGHAYLFSGPRGTGKTTMARLFARAIGVDAHDLYELDAASHTGVDNMRELLDGVATRPFASPYKAYIIDEVHMLSKGAFNAFLKTLEEPPPFAVFILATTELEKVPETIQSRCQVFTLNAPSRGELSTLVLEVTKKEKASMPQAAADMIAMMGDGSYRDTLSTLQKVLTLSEDKKLTEEEVAKVVGAPTTATVIAFLKAISVTSAEEALLVVHDAFSKGIAPQAFVMLAIAKLRSVLLLRYGGASMKKRLVEEFGADEIETLAAFVGKEGEKLNSKTLAELISARIDMQRSPEPAVALELAVYRLFEV